MRLISSGAWLSEALTLEMTEEEYEAWYASIVPRPRTLFTRNGKSSTQKFFLVNNAKVVVFILSEAAAEVRRKEAAAVG